MTNEERERFEAGLRERRKDLIVVGEKNKENVRKVIRFFEKQISGIAQSILEECNRKTDPNDEDRRKLRIDSLRRQGECFLRYLNNLAEYIGDPKKTFDQFMSPANDKNS